MMGFEGIPNRLVDVTIASYLTVAITDLQISPIFLWNISYIHVGINTIFRAALAIMEVCSGESTATISLIFGY